MIKLKQAVVVEGRYDKAKLSSILDALIIETGGFQIYKDKQKLELIRTVAKNQGIIILTDSDAAGFQIRGFLSGAIDPKFVSHAYIPDIKGKERRKPHPSAEGKLGVEGVSKQVLLEALQKAGIVCEQTDDKGENRRRITKTDLYLAGLSGGQNSEHRRKLLLKKLGLPEHLNANSLVKILNTMLNYDNFLQIVGEIAEI